ncbi:MAG TPA: class I SAM-dependent methyltransferase, partial [Longimicrobiales bacterium]|nr:class I SAM-dependent methyltransferase [Longimicrobiales bacterium]
VLGLLRDEIGLEPRWVVADVGSGTGIATELFLRHGNTVFAVEPNEAMRRAAERRLGGHPGFRSVSGAAERTGLPPGTLDLVVAAQAFHWFDAEAAREEFARVLRKPRRLALIWNTRDKEATAFLRD